jgi:flagellar biosynthesis protein FlhG
MHSRKPLFAFGGGKGGVGKSFLSSNVGIYLARRGLRVAVIDADLGGANLHTFMGMELPRTTLADFIAHKSPGIGDVLVKTPVENLWLGAGVVKDLAAPNFKHSQKQRMIRSLKHLDFDAVLLDLGAGTSYNVLDFFAAADCGILVTLPEPTAVENCYRFLKSSFFRHLRNEERDGRIKGMLDFAMTGEEPMRGPLEFIAQVATIDRPKARQFSDELEYFRVALIVNQVRSAEDRSIAPAIAGALKRFYGFNVRPLGDIAYDDSIWLSVRQRQPIMAGRIETIAARDTVAVGKAIYGMVHEYRSMR